MLLALEEKVGVWAVREGSRAQAKEPLIHAGSAPRQRHEHRCWQSVSPGGHVGQGEMGDFAHHDLIFMVNCESFAESGFGQG
jgi:hypothetical protein